MDSGSAFLIKLIGVFLCAATPLIAAAESRVPKHQLWEIDDPKIVNPRSYTECLNKTDTPQIKLGRIAFHSPRLLGGQAGRMGLNCNSCHVAGRDNPRFQLEPVSGKPGTVDLTHAFFNSSGFDQIVNPVPIPDLSKRDGLKFEVRETVDFERHLTTLIEEEFSGPPVNSRILRGLTVYLEALTNERCRQQFNPSSFEGHVRILLDTLSLIGSSQFERKPKVILFLIKSFRSQLETMFLLFGNSPDQQLDKMLVSASRSAEQLIKIIDDHAQIKKDVEDLQRKLEATITYASGFVPGSHYIMTGAQRF